MEKRGFKLRTLFQPETNQYKIHHNMIMLYQSSYFPVVKHKNENKSSNWRKIQREWNETKHPCKEQKNNFAKSRQHDFKYKALFYHDDKLKK